MHFVVDIKTGRTEPASPSDIILSRVRPHPWSRYQVRAGGCPRPVEGSLAPTTEARLRVQRAELREQLREANREIAVLTEMGFKQNGALVSLKLRLQSATTELQTARDRIRALDDTVARLCDRLAYPG